MDKPKRRLELTLKLGADSWPDIVRTLEQIAFQLDGYPENGWHSASGSPSEGYILDIEVHPDVTHDSYFEAIERYKVDRLTSVAPISASDDDNA